MNTKRFQKLFRFSPGEIRAKGFLKQQMLRGKDGMAGHLFELEPDMIANPFTEKTPVPAWEGGNQNGWGAEISGNYWTGYIQFAFILDDADMIKRATKWVDTMLKKQRRDGYLGTYYEADADIYDDYNAWGTACALRGLIAFYEATGREDVLAAVHRALLWFCENWSGDKKTTYAGPYIIEPMIFVYHYTGDRTLVNFCEEYLEFVCERDIFDTSYKTMLYGDYRYNSSHTAGYGCQSRLPALVYTATGKKEYLASTARALDNMHERSVQVTGSPVSDNEYLSPVGAVSETEYCCYAFFNEAYSYMGCITGDAKYGDRMETMFYNGAQGARKKDEKAIAYMNSPNQVYATVNSSRSNTDMQVYAPCYPTSCCPVNSVTVIPEFVRGTVVHDKDDNIYIMAYGPCSVKTKKTELEVKTLYPFRNTVSVEILCERSFELYLRIPSFAKGYTVTVDGKPCDFTEKDGFAVIKREWSKGDVAEICFNAEVETVVLHDDDCCGNHPIAVKYGALVFAYHIPEKWEITPGRPMTKLPDGWHWYNVLPDFEEYPVGDGHEKIGRRKEQISWNIAIDENISAGDFEIELCDTDGYVWETPKIKLHTHMYRAPHMFAPYPMTTYEPYGEYHKVTERLPITLVPYGCTNLRITYFPKARFE